MNTYLIIYNEESSSDILKDRIKNLGHYYNIFKSNWLVKTEMTTAKEVYNTIMKDDNDMKAINLVIFQINPEVASGYWGFTNNALWKWLKD